MDCYLPGSSVYGDSLGKNNGLGCHFLLKGSFQPRDQTQVSCIGRWILYHQHHLGSLYLAVVVTSLGFFFNIYFFDCVVSQLCVSDAIFCSVHGLSSWGSWAQLLLGMWDLSSLTRDRTCIPCMAIWTLNPWTTREVPVMRFLIGNGEIQQQNSTYSFK